MRQLMAAARDRPRRARSEVRKAAERWQVATITAGALALVLAGAVFAQQPIFYPAKGQSSQKQQTDTAECQVWAKQTTGVDPVAIAQSSQYQPAAQQPQGGMLRGAAGGAAAGAAIGAIAGNAGKGAAIGALTGTVGAGVRGRRREEAAIQQQQATQQNTSMQLSTFNRAVTACMTGRGYTSQ